MAGKSRLALIVQYVRNVEKAAQFYAEGLGLKIDHMTAEYAEVSGEDRSGPPIALHLAENEAMLSTSYSPRLTFLVDDLDQSLPHLLSFGATMDGRVQYTAQAKTAQIRSPDGQMLGLVELAN